MPLETFAIVSVPYVTREEWCKNAREAIDFARELRESHYDDPAQAERVRSGIGRLVRWADGKIS